MCHLTAILAPGLKRLQVLLEVLALNTVHIEQTWFPSFMPERTEF